MHQTYELQPHIYFFGVKRLRCFMEEARETGNWSEVDALREDINPPRGFWKRTFARVRFWRPRGNSSE